VCYYQVVFMAITEAYMFLFFDSFISMLIMLPNSHMAFKVMTAIGEYSYSALIPVALIGDVLGSFSNYLIGYIISYVQHNIRNKKSSQKLQSLTLYVQKRLFVLVFFSFMPLIGVLLTTSSGFFRINIKKFIAILILGRLAYYFFLILRV
jgi:membrane protein YqaA with SNARE-associated domain